MAKKHRVKITVVKRLSPKEVFGDAPPEVPADLSPYCDRLNEGQEFIVDESGTMPQGFCSWAWHDIYPALTGLRFGCNYPWVTKEGMTYSCCTDGVRPVIFKIERA